MITHGELIKELFKKTSLPRSFVALRNYLLWQGTPEVQLNADSVDRFVKMLFQNKDWQSQRSDLLRLIEQSFELMPPLNHPQLNQTMEWTRSAEVFEVSNPKSLFEVYKSWQKFREVPGVRKSLMFNSDRSQLYEVSLNSDDQVQAMALGSQFYLLHGNLEPLNQEFTLNFDENLNLVSGKFANSQESFVSFQTNSDGNFNVMKIQKDWLSSNPNNMVLADLSQDSSLFYTITKLEASLLAPECFPTRNTGLQILNQTLHLLRTQRGLTPLQFDNWLKTQDLIENVFHHDKELSLLLRECEFEFKKAEIPWQNNLKDSTKSSQTQASALVEQPIDLSKKEKSLLMERKFSNSELELI